MFLFARMTLVLILLSSLSACTGFFFHPMKEHVFDPKKAGFTYRDIDFEAADGTKLHGWLFPAEGERLGSLLFLHGNAQNISTHFASVAWLAKKGFDVFAFDYRGYGRSAGEPDLDGLHQDIAAGLDTLMTLPEVDPDRVAVLGQSLGGALALTAVAGSPRKSSLRALIIEGAFSDYRGITRDKLASHWLTWPLQWPVSLTIDGHYSPVEAAAAIAPLPLLIIKDEADRVIPPHHSEELFDAAGEPKTIWRLPDVDHIQAFASIGTRNRLVAYLEDVLIDSNEE